MAAATATKNICVIGAGLIGVSSALSIARRLPNSKVTLISEKFSANTGSVHVGDAIWRPWTLDGVFEATGMEPTTIMKKCSQIRNWECATRDHLKELLDSGKGPHSGVEYVAGYNLYTDHIENLENSSSILSSLEEYPLHKRLEITEVDYMFPSRSVSDAVFVMTILVNAETYLGWLTQELVETGRAKILQKRVENLGEVAGKFDVVVNCTGLGARDLIGDFKVYPNKGQVVLVKEPSIKNYVFLTLANEKDRNCYIYPSKDGVIIGGSYLLKNWNFVVKPNLRDKMIEDAAEIYPSLKTSEVIKDVVGPRCERKGGPRVEAEILPFVGRSLKVVHNYGHAGYAVSLHWGCAEKTAWLVDELLSNFDLMIKSNL